ncbi:hypothetical protein Tco_0441834 [Tanacetum coccineum]
MTGLGLNEYTVVLPTPAQVYLPSKNDLSWIGLPEFVDDTVTDYSRPTPSIDVSKDVSDEQKAIWKSNSASFSEQGGSVGNVVSKPMIRFAKETGCPIRVSKKVLILLLKLKCTFRSSVAKTKDKEERQRISRAEGLIQDLLQKIFMKAKDQMMRLFGAILSRRYGLGLLLYRAPCAIKGVLRLE